MEPITTLTGYILSRLLHGIRITLLIATFCLFNCHVTLARNIKNKAPTSDGDGRSLRNIQLLIPENPSQEPALENEIQNYGILYNEKQNLNTHQEDYKLLNGTSPQYEIAANHDSSQSKSEEGDEIEIATDKLQSFHILNSVQQQTGASDSEMALFSDYYYDKINGTDRFEFWNKVESKQITTDADIQNYALLKITEYVNLFNEFRKIEKENPASLNQINRKHSGPPIALPPCNPACDNIGFENGNLSAWYAYYAENTSTTKVFKNTTPVGGACGAVTSAALDPNTNTYQVTLMSGAGVDPIAGALIPVVCPTGGSYSCRIGDGPTPHAQMGILEQTFTVTEANANFTYMYAVVLENPSHAFYQQPYFNVQILDQNGNQIPSCGNYSVVSGPGIPGYTGIYYKPDKDTVYCKPWSTVYVPLQAYIGQCVTIVVTSSDCALGAHFGYAYFDATCLAGIITSFPVLCSNEATLNATAPSGASSYQWYGPCIVGASNQQTVTVSCPGVYKVAIASVAGSGCTDTIVDTVIGSTVPTVSVTQPSTDITCYGGSNGTASATISGGFAPFQYLWTPSGETNSVATNLTAGTYTVTVTDSIGCTATITTNITQPPALTATAINTPVLCNGGNTGSASVTTGGGTPPYTYSWSPSGGTNASANNLKAGTYTVTVTDANGCIITSTTNITQPAVLAATATGSQEKCHGGNTAGVTVTASGGTPAYSYSWAPGGGTSATTDNLAAGIYTVTIADADGCTVTATATVTQPAALNATTTEIPVNCFGNNTGDATVTASGGIPGYTYSWAPTGGTKATASNLAAGSYTVTVTDANGCIATSTDNVTQPTAVNATIVNTPVECNGGNTGTATATASGGTPAYSYSWAPGGGTNATATNFTAGTYTVTVKDANGCTTTASTSIGQPPVLTATTSATPVKCNGGNTGSATVTGSGGTAPYTYSWSNGQSSSGATGLIAGTYTATITDANGCTATGTAKITQPTALTTATTTVPVKCNGGNTGSATVTASGGTPAYTYSWSDGQTTTAASGLSAGTYPITITDANGCTATATVTINQPAILTATTSVTDIKCNGSNTGSATVTAGGGTPGYTYLWNNGQTTGTATGLSAGNYSVAITDANGCNASANITITQPTSAVTATTTNTPVKCNGGNTGSATVTASGGSPAYTYSWAPGGGTNATVNNLTAGSYTVTITDANGCTATVTSIISQPAGLTATTTSVPAECNGSSTGSAMVTAGGGTSAYSYSWTPGGGTNASISNLTAGTYTATVTDANGCTAKATVAVTQPPAITASVSVTTTACGLNNGSGSVTASGGTGAFTYSWAPSGYTGGNTATYSNLAAGIYTCTITDANGCTKQVVILTNNSAGVTATTTTVPVKCNGGNTGSATITVTGSTGPFFYDWSPSGGTNATISNVPAGLYSCEVTNAEGCVIIDTVTISQPAVLAATIITTPVKCNGGNTGSATVTANGGTPAYKYSWSPAGGTNATASNLTAGTYTVTITDANNCSTTATAIVAQSSGLTASTTTTPARCNGSNTGSVTVTAAGGTPNYTYLWSNGQTTSTATGFPAGNYTVTVTITDANNCSITDIPNVTITQPPALTTATSSIPVKCNGGATGSATITAGGGTPGYTYSWSNGETTTSATGLSAGTYAVTVTDANGCTATVNITITQPTALTAATTNTPVKCNGGNNGSTTVTAGGGTPAYTYSWSNGQTTTTVTGLPAGNSLTVTVTDANGCSITANAAIITQPVELTAAASAIPVKCNGGNTGSALVTAGGGTPAYTYSWSNGQTGSNNAGLSIGNYTVTVTDANGCTSTATATVSQPAVLAATATAIPVKCNGGTGSVTVTAGGGTPGYTYSWTPGGGTNATAKNLVAGTYTATVTDANGCSVTTTANITQPATLTASTTSSPVKCNGEATGSATVTANGGTPAYTYSWAPGGGTNATADNLAKGTYTVTVSDANGCTATATNNITQPAALTANATTTSVKCNGEANGSAAITAGGGTTPYTYLWTPAGGTNATADSLAAGTYTVSVTDANGCNTTAAANITQPSVITATIINTPVKCNGGNTGSVKVTAAGGIPAYTYSWAPAGGTNAIATNLSAGTYTVTITDNNGCSATATTLLTQPANALSATITTNPIKCNGSNTGSAIVNATGGTSPYAYSWAPSGGTGATGVNLTTGTYTCTITDINGCTTTDTGTITQPPAIADYIVSLTNATCGSNNGNVTVTASGGTGALTYSWAPAGYTGGNTATYSNLPANTYTCTITDANGCTKQITVLINNIAGPTATLSEIGELCYGGNNGSAIVHITSGTGPFTYNWAPSGGTGSTANTITTGIYSVTITDKNGCITIDTITVTQPTVIKTIVTTTPVKCNGGNTGSAMVTISGGTPGYTYLWAPAGGNAATAGNLQAGTYTVTITDSNQCTASTLVSVSQPAALASIPSSTEVSCNGGNNGSVVDAVSGGTPPYTYSWTPGGGKGSSEDNLTAGTYTVTSTDANGCTITSAINVTQPKAIATSASSSGTSCNGGNNGSATIVAGGGTPPYQYSWAPYGGSNSVANNLAAGTYTVTVTDSNNCKYVSTIIVAQPAALSELNSTTDVGCYGGSNGTAKITVKGGFSPYSYSWIPKVSTSDSATKLATGTYIVTVTDAHNCITEDTINISQPKIITATTTVQPPSCYGLQNGSATILVSGGVPSYTYIWSTSPAQHRDTADNLGIGTYTVLVTDANGCTKKDTVIVTQPAKLTSSIINTTNLICYGDSNGSATVAVSGGTLPYQYLWSTVPPQTSNQGSKLSAGTYTINIADAHNCPVSDTVTITQPPPVTTTATAPDSICSGTTVTIVAAGHGGNGTYTYQWSTGVGSIATQNVTPVNSTTYTITATDGKGCIGTPATVTINTWNLGPADVSVTPHQFICYGDTVTLFANVTNANSGSVNIHWSNGYSGSGPFHLIITNDSTFTVTVMNQCGSEVTKTIPVTINPLPHIEIPAKTSASCKGAVFTYDDTTAANKTDSYAWNFGDGTTGNTNPISHSYSQSGLYLVTVIVTTPAGCSNKASAPANITIYPTAKANFTANPDAAPITNPVIDFIDGSINTNKWKWDFGDNSAFSIEESPSHRYADTGTFTVHLYTNNSFGCPDTTKHEVHISPEFTFYVPDAFTPNGDGLNDYFTGKGVGVVDFDMVIYDRWGMKIFETQNMEKGWDGRANGGQDIAQEDTYVYIIKLTDIFKNPHSYIGRVTLIK
ncbi:MAG: PKD domain-containing protein [Bacteroidia bacterium]